MGTTVFDFVYTLITGYICPLEANFPYFEQIVIGLCFLVTVGILWTCFLRPFYLLFKYHLFGGSKKSSLTRKRRFGDDDD